MSDDLHAKLLAIEPEWDGLARSIMMWLDFDRSTPWWLFKHLEQSGQPIPQWLRDEPEMQSPSHVPSKGTRCVILWKAMLPVSAIESLLAEREREVREACAKVGGALADQMLGHDSGVAQAIRDSGK